VDASALHSEFTSELCMGETVKWTEMIGVQWMLDSGISSWCTPPVSFEFCDLNQCESVCKHHLIKITNEWSSLELFIIGPNGFNQLILWKGSSYLRFPTWINKSEISYDVIIQMIGSLLLDSKKSAPSIVSGVKDGFYCQKLECLTSKDTKWDNRCTQGGFEYVQDIQLLVYPLYTKYLP